MTEQRIKELRGLCERATAGPWYTERDTTGDLIVRYGEQGRCLAIPARGTDAEFIAAARTALPELLDEVSRLTAELAAEKKRADAAVSDLEELMYTGYECDFCTKGTDEDCGYHDGLRESCCPKWRGPVAAEGEKE